MTCRSKKIATFNVYGIGIGIGSRLNQIVEWLASSRPDVVCMQELKSPDVKAPLGRDPQ